MQVGQGLALDLLHILAAAHERASTGLGDYPVSYTHLTLPTTPYV